MLLFRCSDREEQQRISEHYSEFGLTLGFLPEDISAHRRLKEILELEHDYICLVQKSVTLPRSFPQSLLVLRDELHHQWPNWGIVGNAGVTPLMYGAHATRRVRYFSDSFTGPNIAGHILPSECLFENVLLINVAAMRETEFEIPELSDPHLLAPLMSIQVLRAGLAVLVAPQLACFRNDAIKVESNFRTVVSRQAEEWFAERISNTTLDVFDGFVDLQATSDRFWASLRIDTALTCLMNAQKGRPLAQVDIVTRSRFERRGMLERNIATVGLFTETASHANFVHSLISDPQFDSDIELDENVKRITSPVSRSGDDRFHLVREAAQAVIGSYIWFVDDDDWLFPNAAELISLMVSVSPPRSTFFLDVMHFEEEVTGTSSYDWPNGRVRPQRRFPSSHFALSLGGQNYVPFCGVIFDRKMIVELSPEIFERITYFEDYTLVLSALVTDGSFPVALDALAAGISMRQGDHSATQVDRRQWNESLAELSAVLSTGNSGSILLSLGSLLTVDQVGRDVRGQTVSPKPRSGHPKSVERIVRKTFLGLRGGIVWRAARRSKSLRRVANRLRRMLA